MVLFRGRVTVPQPNEEVYEGRVDPETCHEARTVAPGWDVCHLGMNGANGVRQKRSSRRNRTAILSSFVKAGLISCIGCEAWPRVRYPSPVLLSVSVSTVGLYVITLTETSYDCHNRQND